MNTSTRAPQTTQMQHVNRAKLAFMGLSLHEQYVVAASRCYPRHANAIVCKPRINRHDEGNSVSYAVRITADAAPAMMSEEQIRSAIADFNRGTIYQ